MIGLTYEYSWRIGGEYQLSQTYQPDTLYAIPRSMGRNEINWQQDKLAVGVDLVACV